MVFLLAFVEEYILLEFFCVCILVYFHNMVPKHTNPSYKDVLKKSIEMRKDCLQSRERRKKVTREEKAMMEKVTKGIVVK
jgi:hypothetical protein